MGMGEAIFNGHKMIAASEVGVSLKKDMTKSEEILAICEGMTEEQLRGLAQLLTDRAEVIRQQKEETAWAKVVKAWKEYRQLCPNEEKWAEVETECHECDWEGFIDVDVFELIDKIVR